MERPAQHNRSSLDPYGIYGARTANRRRALQRRRQMQEYGMLGALVALAITAVLFWQMHRVPTLDAIRREPLQVRLSAAPVAVPNIVSGSMQVPTTVLLPTEGGQLLRLNTGDISEDAEKPLSLLNAEAPLRGQPLVAGQRAFAPCEDGVLYALDWSNGRQLWRYDTGDAITTRPARLVWREKIAASDEAAPDEDDQSDEEGQSSAQQGSVRRAVIFAGNDAGLVVALDESSGRALWRQRLPAPIGNALAVTAGRDGQPRVLVPLLAGPTGGGGLWCLDARNGQTLWKFPATGTVFAAQFGAPLVVDASTPGADMAGAESVYFANDAGAVFRLNLSNGQTIWKTFATPLPNSDPNMAVVLRGEPLWKEYPGEGRRLFVGGQDGGVRCFDADKGDLLWTFDAGAPVNTRPQPWSSQNGAPDSERLLIGCDDARVFVLDPATGTALARLRTQGEAFAGALPLEHGPVVISREGTAQLFAPLE